MKRIHLALLSALPLTILFLFLPGCRKNQPPADREIKVVMKKYSFEPAEIRVKSGELVELHLTTADVQHGLDIPDLGIKEPVQPGQTATVRFKAPAKGEYKIVCGVICGPHHEEMQAKLIVE
jgi:cytochrome c oxidase subunit II